MIINDIEIKLIRKDIKNVHLYVKPPLGQVELTCPLNFTDENARLFVQSKIEWIKNKKREYEEHSRQTHREFVSGESVYLWGIKYYLVVVDNSRQYSIKIDGKKIVYTIRKGSTSFQKANHFNEWYRDKLKKEIDQRLPQWEEKTGLYSNSYTIKIMKSRWGSCDHEKKSLIFNLLIVQKEITCLNYIILHELAHISEKTHNANFIKILDYHMPNWREVKKTLNNSISAPWSDKRKKV